ncbi:uncharacterized protein LOC131009905 [Salvia miltiorrhiza]|uniref:uncharacterized protein LOC131009905 n=1 Tax=Salvia miltiorrhiza TaxID=226208 RepID=UPI0025AD7EDE|nr:uncharacterized protein LOC131009905 [Salvia miltiorrhiza]
MEQNLPIIAKKFLKIVKVLYFMLRKGISKGKILADLSMLMKRGKIAGKAAIHSLMSHHHHGGTASASDHHLEYEFRCSNTPAHRGFHIPFHLSKRKHSQPTQEELMAAAVEIFHSAAASPELPGFGPSPMVRQLRITDSPFPLRNGEEDSYVDEAAEEFIMRFYKDLRQQNSVPYLGYS